MYAMFNPLVVSNNIIERGIKENISISPMKLQKLLYLLYREHLKSKNVQLFTEKFQAWQYGPVLQTVYDEFKGYGASPICKYYRDSQEVARAIDLKKACDFNETFEMVWENYKHVSAIELSTRTHQPGGAWDKAIKNEPYLLEDEDIKDEQWT